MFVCRKCLKRSDDPKGIIKGIKKAIKRETKRVSASNGKSPRIVVTSCFGLCPKRAVVMTGSARAARGEYVLVTAAGDVAGALARLHDTPDGSTSKSSST
ncbi:conserved hypothetical protein [Bradyrhizobium sp. STM 3809]|nr:conserved hypothetical protein [Bradyrhizobium sp. STM 3809]